MDVSRIDAVEADDFVLPGLCPCENAGRPGQCVPIGAFSRVPAPTGRADFREIGLGAMLQVPDRDEEGYGNNGAGRIYEPYEVNGLGFDSAFELVDPFSAIRATTSCETKPGGKSIAEPDRSDMLANIPQCSANTTALSCGPLRL